MPGLRHMACLVSIATAFSAAGCGSSAHDKAIAKIGHERITQSSLSEWTTAVHRADPAGMALTPSQRALTLLLDWARTRHEARQLGVSTSVREASHEIAVLTGPEAVGVERPPFSWESAAMPYLNAGVATHDEQVALVRMALLRERLLDRQIALAESHIGPKSVRAYYNAHKRSFYVTERRDIKAVMNKNETAVVAAKRAMQAHKPFSEIAEKYNRSIEGGLRLGRAPGSQTKRYEKDFFDAPLHVLIGPHKELMYYVFEVFNVRPGYQRSLPSVTPDISRLLAERAVAQAQASRQASWRAETVCLRRYATPACATLVASVS
jgi:hypothetical protein